MTDTLIETTYPILVTDDGQIPLPGVFLTLPAGTSRSKKAVEAGVAAGGQILVVPPAHPDVIAPGPHDLAEVGVLGEIITSRTSSVGKVSVVVRLAERMRIVECVDKGQYLAASVAPLATVVPEDDESTQDLMATLREAITTVLVDKAATSETPTPTIDDVDDPDDLVEVGAAHIELDRVTRMSLLTETDTLARIRTVLPHLVRQHEVLERRNAIRGEVVDATQRETREELLRERLRAIREELGEETSSEIEDLRDRAAKTKLPEEAKEAVKKQLSRMAQMSTSSPEYNIATTYVGWILDLPWYEHKEESTDIAAARAILDADHSGLEKVKKRILEFIAVRKLAPNRRSPILCFAGPPGVGKTSLAKSIATSLNRDYVRISLGGIRDDAEIRGHRRTYVGALPGRIISGLKKAGTNNPVFVLDEIDKLSNSHRGDPASALLEVLDPEQNSEMVDHYLEVPVDLSTVMFICTANHLETIPSPLRDRMEIIEVPGYTVAEKLEIARRHLLPKQMGEHGLTREQLELDDDALLEIVERYTRESGVRNLERELAGICRFAAVMASERGAPKTFTITKDKVAEILGPPRATPELLSASPVPGVVTGLAWTPMGGDILFIEAASMPGKGNLRITGQTGDVMQESARTAHSWVRSNAKELDIDLEVFNTRDIHLHIPAGAVKKDGPSAGVAMATALVSLLQGRALRPDVAITGEITLRGRILPVGGIKEKVIAAHRAGAKLVLLPERNRKDVIEIPKSVRDDVTIALVSRVHDAIAIAYGDVAPPADDTIDANVPPPTKLGIKEPDRLPPT